MAVHTPTILGFWTITFRPDVFSAFRQIGDNEHILFSHWENQFAYGVLATDGGKYQSRLLVSCIGYTSVSPRLFG